jgi:adenosylcobinamide-GDP ribazoletransferase
MGGLLEALRFLTILPIGSSVSAEPARLAVSAPVFPVAGAVIGCLVAAAAWCAALWFPPPATAAVAVAASALLTGGLHLDGLADLCDGLAAGGGRERMLAVMRDSRIGAVGATGLITALMLKFGLAEAVVGGGQLGAFVAAGAVSRAALVLAAARAPYARADGLGAAMIGRVTPAAAGWAGAIGAAIAVGALGPPGLAAAGVVALGVVGAAAWLTRRLAGLTGDCLGAIGELSEIVVLGCAVAAAGANA